MNRYTLAELVITIFSIRPTYAGPAHAWYKGIMRYRLSSITTIPYDATTTVEETHAQVLQTKARLACAQV